jgi:hypothetical protein
MLMFFLHIIKGQDLRQFVEDSFSNNDDNKTIIILLSLLLHVLFLMMIKGQDLRQFLEDSFSVGPVDAGICDGLAVFERLAGVLDIPTQTETIQTQTETKTCAQATCHCWHMPSLLLLLLHMVQI